MAADMDKRGTSGKGLEKKRKGETPPNTQGLKPPKAQGWWESSTTGAPRRPREQRRALGEGRGARGRFPSPCRLAWRPSSLLAARSLLGCSSAGPQGGIGCKQAPEYCLMEPAKAQLNPGEREGGDRSSSPRPPQSLPPTCCPILYDP